MRNEWLGLGWHIDKYTNHEIKLHIALVNLLHAVLLWTLLNIKCFHPISTEVNPWILLNVQGTPKSPSLEEKRSPSKIAW